MPEFQAVMARLLERCILPGHLVDPNNLCISSGKRQLPATACRCLPAALHCRLLEAAWPFSAACAMPGPHSVHDWPVCVRHCVQSNSHYTSCCQPRPVQLPLPNAMPAPVQAAAPFWTICFTASVMMATAC
jgi:hypothetical protein